ncbi:MAG TPA: N-acetylmuramic acid 6-phosphate etherase [Symbiobacteriaceae bacterium]|jgi:N-acetylmuramic acid 6-phosphate etherase
MDLDKLVTERINERTKDLDSLSTADLVRAMNDEDKLVALAVEQVLPQVAQTVDIMVNAIRHGGRVFYIGAGTSGRLGVMDASECPPTFSVSPDLIQGIIAGGFGALVRSSESMEDSEAEGLKDLQEHGVNAGDVVIALAASGRTPYAIAALEGAKALGARAVGLTCNPDSEMARVAEVTIAPVVGPEAISGSTRLKAGTAQKLVLNMLSTATMVRLGKTYGNLMVDVRPTNAKLVERARRIIMQATNSDYETASRALDGSGNQVKVAVVMCLAGADAELARAALDEAGGFVRQAVAMLQGKTNER